VAGGKNSLVMWNTEYFFANPVHRNKKLPCRLDAQTICPRVPRKLSVQGHITMGNPPPTKVLHHLFCIHDVVCKLKMCGQRVLGSTDNCLPVLRWLLFFEAVHRFGSLPESGAMHCLY
jgi:hypothetical protein